MGGGGGGGWLRVVTLDIVVCGSFGQKRCGCIFNTESIECLFFLENLVIGFNPFCHNLICKIF